MSSKNSKAIRHSRASGTFTQPLGCVCGTELYGSIDTSLLYEELRRKFEIDNTPIEVEFRTLVDWVRLGDQYTHQIHSYPAKLLPNIIHFFVRASSLIKPGSYILDPFSGSGTVALEASLAGHIPLIADANPLSSLITAVKTTPYDCSVLRKATGDVIRKAKRFRSAKPISIINSDLWYESDRKKELEKLLRSIREIENKEIQDFLLICFSTVARKLSLADPAISVPVRLKTKDSFSEAANSKIIKRLSLIANASVLDEFLKISVSNIDRVENANQVLPTRRPAALVSTDARNISYNGKRLDSESVPMIITSPPYGSAQKYIRSSSLSLNWLGLALPSELAKLESKSIGREHVPGIGHIPLPSIPKRFMTLLQKLQKINLTRYQITLQYLNDMSLALAEMARVVSPSGVIIIVVGNNQVCGEELDNAAYCISVLQSKGFRLGLHLIDKIKSRGLMTKRKAGAPVILRESVLVFSKEGGKR